MVMGVAFIGAAGSGKTSLVHAYGGWLRRSLFQRVAQVNLDPGAENVPYRPVFDVREMFTIRDVMRRYGLGPNGAFIKSSELVAENMEDILKRPPFSNPGDYDFILIDTPGQMEAFIFRPSSSVFFEKLGEKLNLVIVYVIDATAIKGLADAIVLWMLGLLAQVKLGILMTPVVNKIDLDPGNVYARYLIESPEKLMELAEEESGLGILGDMAPELVGIALKSKQALRPVMVSAYTGEGMEELHYLVHEAFCTCGDLT